MKEKEIIDLIDVTSHSHKVIEKDIIHYIAKGIYLTNKFMVPDSDISEVTIEKEKNSLNCHVTKNGVQTTVKMDELLAHWGRREIAYFQKYLLNRLTEEKDNKAIPTKKIHKPYKKN